LAFDSARFAISALIFSIKVLISGAATLRVEFMALPSSELVGGRLIKFRQQAINQKRGTRLPEHEAKGDAVAMGW
jgi:hypothetical protein